MIKKITILLTVIIMFYISNSAISYADIDNRERINNTFENKSTLFTSFLDTENSTCTSVLLNKNTALTAKHCIKGKEKNVGTLYPAQSSSVSTPLGSISVDDAFSYEKNDLALLKWDVNSMDKSATYYISNQEMNIRVVDPKHGDLEGKDVYTIGYPSDIGENNQYISKGKILNVNENVIQTDLSGYKGQSGSGLFLKESGELIGIMTNAGIGQANFAPLTSQVNEWIKSKK